jgi:hypothetical protein
MLYVIGWRAVDLHETCIFVMWVYFSSERFSSAENKRKMKGQKKNNLISLRLSQVPKPLCMYFCFPLCLIKLLWCLRSTPLSRRMTPFTRCSNAPVNTQIRPNGIVLLQTVLSSIVTGTRVKVSLKGYTGKIEKVQHQVTVTTLSYTTMTISYTTMTTTMTGLEWAAVGSK